MSRDERNAYFKEKVVNHIRSKIKLSIHNDMETTLFGPMHDDINNGALSYLSHDYMLDDILNDSELTLLIRFRNIFKDEFKTKTKL